MENNKLFQKIWRFNAIIIALAGMLAIAFLSIGLAFIAKDFYDRKSRGVTAHDVVNTSQIEEVEEKLELGSPESIDDSDYIKFPLVSRQSYRLSYSKGKTASATRNLLFFNNQDNSSHWLLDKHDYLLTSQRLYRKQNNESIITGFLYEVIKKDTNNDDRLTENDKSIIAISNTNGKKYNEIITDIDQVIDVEKNNGIAYIVYKRSDKRYLATVDMQNLTLIKNVELVLPKLPNHQ